MSERIYTYDWRIIVRHERNGFAKTVHVDAATSGEAIASAIEAVASDRYPDGFEVIELARGQMVGIA